MRRTIETPGGPLSYELTRKAVKNLNFRLLPGGELAVSAPRRVLPDVYKRQGQAGVVVIGFQRVAQGMAEIEQLALPGFGLVPFDHPLLDVYKRQRLLLPGRVPACR